MRIKDPRKSLDFYSRVIGMRLLGIIDAPNCQFTLYYFGFCEESKIPTDKVARKKFAASFPGALELMYCYGTDTDENFTGYHDGNKDPKGIGHIGIYVPDVYAACERFEKLNVPFIKKPDSGKLKGLAFIQDPDGYWIEILNEKFLKE
ncbi:Lactoylglutathione lyase [Holothuria leucospilota]|uniref:Aldoketomutase n=1 Tax=Holothuria leucospilota TaxID=206669 RepID=A0A9Q1CIP9_HOLLE|nr:Lactoylglutathione lyase [Holothuria leucospilota]